MIGQRVTKNLESREGFTWVGYKPPHRPGTPADRSEERKHH